MAPRAGRFWRAPRQFVTDAFLLRGLSAAQIAEKLEIPATSSFKVIEFSSEGINGIAVPIRNPSPGFVGKGFTSGGLPEFVMPNLNTHRDTQQGDFMTQWNQRHGSRFVLHYTPTHGSWLNQVELWFCVLSRRILRYAEFRSPDELVVAIERFIQHWNETDAHPFRWTYDGLPLVR